jgi:predicted nucleic acid-binding Zn ribbon protein
VTGKRHHERAQVRYLFWAIMKRQKRLTKTEKKAVAAIKRIASGEMPHIHCIACGRHIDPREFVGTNATAKMLYCKHEEVFPSCIQCEVISQLLIDEHDRSGAAVKPATAWH